MASAWLPIPTQHDTARIHHTAAVAVRQPEGAEHHVTSNAAHQAAASSHTCSKPPAVTVAHKSPYHRSGATKPKKTSAPGEVPGVATR